MEERTKESMVGCAMIGGFVMAGIGFVTTAFVYAGAVGALVRRQDPNLWMIRGIGPALMLLGLLVAGGAIVVGIREGRRLTSGKGQVYADPNARIVARFGIDEHGDMITEEWLFDERDEVRFFVKIQHADGRIKEYQCTRETLAMCGEGMRGTATFDGRWLGGFVPQIGPRPAP